MTMTWILFDKYNLRSVLWESWHESRRAGTSLEGMAVQAELTRGPHAPDAPARAYHISRILADLGVSELNKQLLCV